MADTIQEGRRIIDQDVSLAINLDDVIIIDSATNGTRQITYSALCDAVAQTLGIAAIKTTADGAMKRSVYDADGDNIVDNAAKVNNHTVKSDVPENAKFTDTVYDDQPLRKIVTDNANSAMQKLVYDTNGDGIVDNAERVNAHAVESDVPADAKFTDTVYDDAEIRKLIGTPADGNYTSKGNSNAANVGALDKQVKAMTDNAKIHLFTDAQGIGVDYGD